MSAGVYQTVRSTRSRCFGVRTRCYLLCRWLTKPTISRHSGVRLRRASPTRPSSSARRCSTTTASPGSTSRARSCSSRTRTGACSRPSRPTSTCPEQDLYLEITVMKQSLVTRKNRKLRKLRERYPDVNVKLFYRRDIERLARRYGLRPRLLSAPDERVGDVYLSAEEIAARVAELGAELARDYAGRSRSSSARSRRASSSSPTSRARCRSTTTSTSSSSPATDSAAASRRAPAQGPRRRDRRPRRAARRGRRRHRADAQLPLQDAAAARARQPARGRRCSTGRTAGSSPTCRCATSASRCRTSSSSATASTSTSGTATCPTCGSSASTTRKV